MALRFATRSRAPGNLYSTPRRVSVGLGEAAPAGAHALSMDNVIPSIQNQVRWPRTLRSFRRRAVYQLISFVILRTKYIFYYTQNTY